MTKAIPNSKRKFLVQEIQGWQEDMLITEEISTKLLSLYPAQASGGSLIGILMTVGAVLIGSGTLLWVAANWTLLNTVCKVSLIIGVMCVSYYGGWYFRFNPGYRPKLGSALLLLGAILYGAGIWLISQIFNTDLQLTDGLFAWALGVLPLAFALNSLALAVLSALLIGGWNLSLHTVAASSFPEALISLRDVPFFVASLGLIAFTSDKLRSRTVLLIGIIYGAIWSALHGQIIGELSYGVSLIALHFLVAVRKQYFARLLLVSGLILSMVTLLAMTFDVYSASSIYQSAGYLLWLVSLLLISCIRGSRDSLLPECLALSLVSWTGLLSFLHPFGLLHALVSNVVLIICLIGMMFAGAHRLKSSAVLNIAVVFLVLDIICRYFDFFFKTSDRSLFFVAGGFLLLITATLLEHNRRKLLGDISK
jgi:uncharacterized membrane protein